MECGILKITIRFIRPRRLNRSAAVKPYKRYRREWRGGFTTRQNKNEAKDASSNGDTGPEWEMVDLACLLWNFICRVYMKKYDMI